MKRFHLGLYGHSACSDNGSGEGSYQKLLLDHYEGKLVLANFGSGQASEERILFELKKTSKLSCAIILHSRPQSIFVPGTRQDICISDDFWNKAQQIWKSPDETQQKYFTKSHSIGEIFPNPATFIETLTLYKKYLSHPDLERNRFEGALLALDSYCCSVIPNTPVYHCIDDRYKPSWFEFRSGTRDKELEWLMERQGDSRFPNCMSLNVNYAVYKYIQENIIDKLI